jgi:fumarylacetoacetate (FAA) hydrolase
MGMKLGSLKSGRDGRLIVVSDDLETAADAGSVAPTMQAALENWAAAAPKLRELADRLNAGDGGGDFFPLAMADCAAPLPRAYQWADGSVYLNHMRLVRQARGAEMPDSFLEDPLIYQGGSDSMLGPVDDVELADEAWGIDFEAEVAVITDDVPMGVSVAKAAGHIKLVTICNDVSLRNLIPNELGKGFGFFQSKSPTSFAPVAVTPDALGDAWDGTKVTADIIVEHNGKWVGNPNAGTDMNFDFAQLIAHAAKTRPLGAGTILGSGTVSNADRSRGSACLAEVRTIETIEDGAPKTPFMAFGDRIRIDMLDDNGRSIFGAIDQKIVKYTPPE